MEKTISFCNFQGSSMGFFPSIFPSIGFISFLRRPNAFGNLRMKDFLCANIWALYESANCVIPCSLSVTKYLKTFYCIFSLLSFFFFSFCVLFFLPWDFDMKSSLTIVGLLQAKYIRAADILVYGFMSQREGCFIFRPYFSQHFICQVI